MKPALISRCLLAASLVALTACSSLPGSGPRLEQFSSQSALPGVTLVDLDETVVRQQLAVERPPLFSQASTGTGTRNDVIGIGDQLEITLIESPPATLFGSGGADPRAPLVAGTMNVPAQVVDGEGYVAVPFVGRVMASGQTPAKLSIEIVRRLRGKANQPDVLVRMLRSESSLVTVVGEVNQSTRMPLNSGRERLLDAIAAAGGSRQPIHKTTLQLTRAEGFLSLPLDRVIQDPRENVLLKAGDVVSLLYQPMAMTVFGATGRQDEVSFESQGITLAQALARAGGLVDHRSAAQGLFLFRLEPAGVQPWTKDAPSVTPDGRVPVVYRLDLRDPRSFFVMQSFKVRNADLLYVANAPAAELQKFLNLVFSAVFPVANLINATN